MHFLKMLTLKEKLMRFMIYVDNVQLAVHMRRFTKKKCNAAYRAQSDNFVPKF